MINKSRLKSLYQVVFSEKLFVIVLMLLAIGLPVAPYLVGVSQFFLLFNWVVEGNYKQKFLRLKSNKALHYFLLVFAVHVVWLINTTNYSYALHDLKIKLPLLALPIIISSSYVLSREQLKQILLIFSATVIVGTFISLWIYMGWTKIVVTDIRDISIFVSHIRFGLMIVLSLFILAYYFRSDYTKLSFRIKLAYSVSILWLLLFLLVLQSITSWVILFVLAFVLIIFYYKKFKYKALKTGVWAIVIFAPVFTVALIVTVLINSYKTDEIDTNKLPLKTKLGNKYRHFTQSRVTENGHYVWLYYCYDELSENWPTYSTYDFNGNDDKEQPLKFTLVRYLTSKNLPKDAEGLSKLDKKDIELIEKGYASCVYRIKFPPYVKLYEVAWELKQYFLFGNPNAKTVSMRIEFFKTGSEIFKDHLLFGVGSGDVQDTFNAYYKKNASRLLPKYRLRAHNQYLTFLISFGILGFALIVLGFLKPIALNSENWTTISLVFIIIMLLSMINEDTLETQSGVTIFAYFYSLLVLRRSSESDKIIANNKTIHK